jgi:hypothetical protein
MTAPARSCGREELRPSSRAAQDARADELVERHAARLFQAAEDVRVVAILPRLARLGDEGASRPLHRGADRPRPVGRELAVAGGRASSFLRIAAMIGSVP